MKSSQNYNLANKYFFLGTAIWFLIITITGFSFSVYFSTREGPLPTHLVVHGTLFLLWILLYLIQTGLISKSKVHIHMTLGFLGLLLILLLIPAGLYPVLYKVSIGTKTIDHGGHNIFTLLAGYVFFFCGVFIRHKAFYHKRLMLFSTLMFTIAAIDRVAFIFFLENNQFFRKLMSLFPVLALFLLDYLKTKKLVWFDLTPVVVVLGIFFLADYFWLSAFGRSLMDFLIGVI